MGGASAWTCLRGHAGCDAARGVSGAVPAGDAVVRQFLDGPAGLSRAHLRSTTTSRAYTDIDTYRVLLTTVLLVGTKTLVAVAIATALAWIVTRTDTPLRGALELLLTAAVFHPGPARSDRLDHAAEPERGHASTSG